MSSQDLPSNTLADVRVFVVDDEDIIAWGMENALKGCGAEILRAASLREALAKLPGFSANVVVCDLNLPDGNGIELLRRWRHEYPDLPVILVTAHSAVDSAITALRLGAFDYLQKPLDMNSLITAVKRAAEISQLRQKVSRMQGRVKERDTVEIIGASAALQLMQERVRRVAKSKSDTVLIEGESGTGKELCARALHLWSARANEPFVEINCASIPEALLESELFGHERGAFTDARERKLGLFEMAHQGTIFLDEIGEMPFKLQSKLLRALEYRRFKRLGGVKDIEFNAQIVAATNRNLLEEVAAGRFRGDLYYRLNILPIRTPPLRERPDDIPALAAHFLGQVASRLGIPTPALAPEAVEKLVTHSWPGNVRELRNVLQRAMVFHEPRTITAAMVELDAPTSEFTPIPALVTAAAKPSAESGPGGHGRIAHSKDLFILPDSGVSLDGVEKNFILQALEKARNNQTRAAQLLGVSRHTLRYRLEKYGLQ